MIFQLELNHDDFKHPTTLTIVDDFKLLWMGLQMELNNYKGQEYYITVTIWQNGMIESSYVYFTKDGTYYQQTGTQLFLAMAQTMQAFESNRGKS